MTERKFIPVAGHPNLVKDSISGAILNTDNSGLEAYKKQKQLRENEANRIKKLENKLDNVTESMEELKSMFATIIKEIKNK
jgi:hypothetical protein